jgi:hypothetical protein
MEERISEGKDRETGPDRHRDMGTAVLALMGPVGNGDVPFRRRFGSVETLP